MLEFSGRASGRAVTTAEEGVLCILFSGGVLIVELTILIVGKKYSIAFSNMFSYFPL